ncbi:breast carcinoma-amplified sequence 1 isoform X5 [Danio rerio]|uniref:Breast carcinoma-amplified sequence 1 isoform X5 n=3 Tax=Danio rerio TaxID=7955 RepID=A0A8M9PF22_DANRE|nr:breast carcinoma-amplified sequence 1 isoform X4 [Danio rerio]|eukprot:XP_021325483.1 breast carcinoma-amplified sequence 1 isoform X4 [Danio rerio]
MPVQIFSCRLEANMGNEQSAQKKRQKANPEKKVHNGELNGHAVPTPDQTEPVAKKEAPVEQKSEAPPVTVKEEPKPPEKEEVDNSKANKPAHVETTPEKKITVTTEPEPPKKASPKSSGDEAPNFFGKMFKKKPEPVKPASEKNDTVDAPVTVLELKIDAQPDPVDIKISTEPEPEPKAEALEPSPVQTTEENNLSEEAKAAEKTVMNFFKTFASTKTSKEAKAADASKEQSQKETPPAPSTNVQEAPKAPPPPPPPAPPKMESKAEPAVKKEETSASKAAAAVKAEPSAKSKTKDGAFSKLFRSKVLLGKMVSKVQAVTTGGGRAQTSGAVDSSKSSTLEAAAKPEEPPAPKPEEKKLEKKSTFGNMFKPKVLLGQVSSRIQAVASSARVSLMSAGAAPESKKETPAPVAEAAPLVKAKEEPKPAAPPAPQPAQDNKSVASTDASPNMPRKLEKRNSLQLFFKNLGQKRHSDAGVQTEPVAAEKAK